VGNSISTDQVKKSDKILEDVFEALVGAIYLDNGIDVVYKYLTKIFKEDIDNTNQDALTDYKTRLQEEMQAEHRDSVHYELVSQIGPAHDRTFTVNVLFENIVLGTGTGKSKKNAEEAAAKDALNKRSI
jgi:ribonuclease-3